MAQLNIANDSDKGTDLDTFPTLRISAALIHTADMLSFQKKNAGQRATTSFQPAIFARARRAHDTYTMNLKIHFKVMVWITVISTVNMEDF